MKEVEALREFILSHSLDKVEENSALESLRYLEKLEGMVERVSNSPDEMIRILAIFRRQRDRKNALEAGNKQETFQELSYRVNSLSNMGFNLFEKEIILYAIRNGNTKIDHRLVPVVNINNRINDINGKIKNLVDRTSTYFYQVDLEVLKKNSYIAIPDNTVIT